VNVGYWHGAALRSYPSLGLICEADLTSREIVATAADDSNARPSAGPTEFSILGFLE